MVSGAPRNTHLRILLILLFIPHPPWPRPKMGVAVRLQRCLDYQEVAALAPALDQG